jgi:hypothetical protein
MLPFECAMFQTNPFKAFMYLSIWYIHLVWIRPQMSNSSTICITKCVMISKQTRGNTFSRVNIISTAYTFSTCMVLGSITFKQSLLNIQLRLIRAIQISSFIKLQYKVVILVTSWCGSHGTLVFEAYHPYGLYFAKLLHNLLEFSIFW